MSNALNRCNIIIIVSIAIYLNAVTRINSLGEARQRDFESNDRTYCPPNEEVKVECILDPSHKIFGEGTFWDASRQTLYFVGGQSTVHSYVPATKQHRSTFVGGLTVYFVIPVTNSAIKFMIGYNNKLCVMEWDGTSSNISRLDCIPQFTITNPNLVLSDGKMVSENVLVVDARDAKLASDFPALRNLNAFSDGSLILFERNQTRTHTLDYKWPNGLVPSADGKRLYVADTGDSKIRSYELDEAHQIISGKKPTVVFDLRRYNVTGHLDSMTNDVNNKIWAADVLGGRVVQVDPEDGTLMRSVMIPTIGTTNCAWGGAYLDELYVSAATTYALETAFNQSFPKGASNEDCGLFRVTGLGTKGFPGTTFDDRNLLSR